MSLVEVRIPDVGDAEEVEVIEICVAEGDEIPLGTVLVVIESEKASMELPAEVAGKIVGIGLAVGDIVNEGDLVATLETEGNLGPPNEAEGKVDQSDTNVVAQERSESRGPDDGNRDGRIDEGEARIEVRVPDVGDAEEIVVIEIAVKPGDSVSVDDPLVVIESEKASMEIPSPVDGTVNSVELALDDEVVEGTLVAVLVPVEPARMSVEAPRPEGVATSIMSELRTNTPTIQAPLPVEPGGQVADGTIYAGPAVRRLARELGVELATVKSSGAHGRIVKDDVKAYVKRILTRSSHRDQAFLPVVPLEDFTKYGKIEEVELTRVRRSGATNLHRSWLNVVHVTQHDLVDATQLEDVRGKMKREARMESR
ncbi:MAG: biotin/lipoyl-containing protein [Pseudomonadota bacterium]|nr:biotin/lipoyl-containing protein [Pseudomonadota bacterium]